MTWTDEDHLRFDIAFALSKLKVRAKPLDEMQRKMAAEQIIAHLKLSNWQFVKGAPAANHGQPRKAQG